MITVFVCSTCLFRLSLQLPSKGSLQVHMWNVRAISSIFSLIDDLAAAAAAKSLSFMFI